MAVDSGTYDQATIARKQKIAEAMLGDSMKPRKIEHWAQGLAQLGQAGVGGYLSHQANEESKAAKAAEMETIAKMIGAGASDPASGPVPQTGSAPAVSTAVPSSSPIASTASAVSAVPSPAPPVPTARAEVMPSAKVWGDREAEAAGLYEPSAKPYKVAGSPAAAPQAPIAQAMAQPQMPPTQPAASSGGLLANATPQRRAAILAGLNASEGSPARAIAMSMMSQLSKPQEFGFQSQPDGTILRTNPRTGTVEPIYQGATKPAFGIIGESEDGKKTYGFIDAAKGKVTPLEAAKPGDERPTVTGPDGKEIVIPKGVDVKKFKADVTSATADAATGKKTEVQAKSEKFGNKMELAERNLKEIEGEGQSYKGRALEGAPLVGDTMATNWAQSENYQKYAQARNNFITALLRDESGAAIGTDEFKRYEKEFFPRPGDSLKIVEQKREARRVAIDGMKKAAGPGYKSPAFEAKAAEAPAGVDAKVWGVMTPEERALWK